MTTHYTEDSLSDNSYIETACRETFSSTARRWNYGIKITNIYTLVTCNKCLKQLQHNAEIKRIRCLFQTAGQDKLAEYANDNEIRILYELQEKSTRLYNETIYLNKRFKEIENNILKEGYKNDKRRLPK